MLHVRKRGARRERGFVERFYNTMSYRAYPPSRMYPAPDRANHKPNFDLTPERDYLDVGWSGGRLSDGRPFRVEYWYWEEVSILTYFMSTKGIEDATDGDFEELLVDEGLLTFVSKDPVVKSKKIRDASGNEMWSINVAVGEHDELFVSGDLAIKRYLETE
jgi:hypothetical protein